ncbi:putative uncharacterized protein [Meiothermus ruber H328]|nr:putative uncharacterized protein [Meiothermus ruber H328]
MVVAGLQAYVKGGPLGFFPCLVQSENLGVGFPSPGVVSFPHDAAVLNQHRAHQGVGMGVAPASFR